MTLAGLILDWPAFAVLPAGTLLVADPGYFSVFSDSRQLGLATLIAVGAIFFGFIVRRMWPRSMNPTLFGWLAATALVGALAYMGVETAGFVLLLFIAGAILLGVLALVFN